MNRYRSIRAYPSRALPQAARRRPDGQDHWEIGIYGDLTDKQPELFGQLLDVPKGSSGTIYFDSCGGSAYVGLGLTSLIRLRGLKATGVVAGECSSAALMPFAACEKRYVTPHATLLFHSMKWQSEEDVRYEEALEWARHFKLLEEDLDSLLSRLFDCSPDVITEWTRPGRFVSGQEVVAAGLAEMVDLFSGDLDQQLRAQEKGGALGAAQRSRNS